MPEFDDHSADYAAKLQQSLPAASGNAMQFQAQKASLIAASCSIHGTPSYLADLGCGIGLLHEHLEKALPATNIVGLDTSFQSLSSANRRATSQTDYVHMPHNEIPIASNSIDICVAACVLHHIAPAERLRWASEIYRILRRGGVACVFEHNPFNPITRWIVNRSPLDANAILLTATETEKLAAEVGFMSLDTRYISLLPPKFAIASRIDKAFRRFPIGAQYMSIWSK